MREFLLVISVLLLAGCPDLVSVDDPRTVRGSSSGDAGVRDNGLCTSSAVWCEDRTQAQCNSGCTISSACRSPQHEHCAMLRDPDTCDTDTACYWSAGSCKPSSGGACDINESASACASAFESCVWGPACTGHETRCYEIETRAACQANLGCVWTT